MALPATKSPAKRKLFEFLKHTKMGDDFVFTHEGTEDQARKFVHRMRVELARLRDVAKERNIVPKHFKMLLRGIKVVDSGSCEITLTKATSRLDVSNEIDEVFDVIGGGARIDGN